MTKQYILENTMWVIEWRGKRDTKTDKWIPPHNELVNQKRLSQLAGRDWEDIWGVQLAAKQPEGLDVIADEYERHFSDLMSFERFVNEFCSGVTED